MTRYRSVKVKPLVEIPSYEEEEYVPVSDTDSLVDVSVMGQEAEEA
jgi:hypothetical protein